MSEKEMRGELKHWKETPRWQPETPPEKPKKQTTNRLSHWKETPKWQPYLPPEKEIKIENTYSWRNQVLKTIRSAKHEINLIIQGKW